VGVLCGWRRIASWAAAGEVAAVIALAGRRAAESGEPGKAHLIEHVDDEIAAALTLTGMSARRLLDVAGGLARLDATRAALAAGVIDWARAMVFADELAVLDDADALAAEAMVLPGAGGMTTGQLRAALRRAVIAVDPGAAVRRRRAARREACVQLWTEPSGNAALAGRELDPADGITGDQWLSAQARWLQRRGAEGTLQQLRLAVFAAVLNGRPVSSLLPAPGDPAGGDPAAAGQPPAGQSLEPADPGGAAPASAPPASGVIHLVMPWSAWLGLTDSPGEAAGYGAVDAGSCRDLTATLAGHPATRWCVTFTGSDGHAVAHACAGHAPPGPPGPGRAPPGAWPPGPEAPAISWLASLRPERLETGDCTHARQARGYTPPGSLAHLVRVRRRTCTYPGCRRPARRCDLDHTIPWKQGGRTCECNLHPACRKHHQAKQAPGWHAVQPDPGTITWTTPSGRSYTTRPDPYPA
jgi:hypothetical protein